MKETEEEAKNLKIRIKALVKNKAKFARDFGIKGGGTMVYQHENAIKPISLEAGKAYAKGLGCTLGEISPRLAKIMELDHTPDFSQHRNVTPAPVGTRKIPLISYVQAGSWMDTLGPYHPSDAHGWLLTDLELSEYAFGLEIKGNSMTPEFNPGDRVIIDPAVSPRLGDFVVAKNGEEEATFKKYWPRGRNEKGEQVVELAPLNPDYESMRSDITPFVIIGSMVEARRYRKK